MRVHEARRSALLLACAGVLAAVAAGHGSPVPAAARASHAQRTSQPRPTAAPATPVAVPTAPPATTSRSHPSHVPFASPTIDPGIPALSVPTAIAVPVGPPPSHPVTPNGITAGLPAIPTLPALTIPESPTPTPGASSPEPPASSARVPAAATVAGGLQEPGPLALAGVALAAGFIGVTSLVDRRREALARRSAVGPGEEPPGR
jgi:hypothetical protein